MRLHHVTVYHNDEARFRPYQDGHRLTRTVSHWLYLPGDTRPETVADWAFHLCNAPLEHLESRRTQPGGETMFLAACVYRLLRLRSLSVGDVVQVATDQRTWWLACDPAGWRPVTAPSNVDGQPLTADKIHHHLRQP